MTVKIDEDNLKQGLLGLVVALVEIIEETLERQALRRMEGGRLSEAEIERLGNALLDVNCALEKIKKENNIEETVKSVRGSLDEVANDAVSKLINPEAWAEVEK